MGGRTAYLDTYRRMLLDMHIPDWDPSFLSSYDPVRLAELYERARVTGVMLYCNSHVGLTNYPAPTGKMHPGLGGRDVVGELVSELHGRDIRACAYYSVLFDNWAVKEHPDWWISPIPNLQASGGAGGSLPRYGVCCPNAGGYVALMEARIRDLVARYDFDCLFYDMTFWAVVCGCDSCRERYRSEEGADIPETVDWTSPDWCRFQAARERWLREFVQRLVEVAKGVRPEMPVYNNFALSVANWVPGFALSLADEVDFLGGDMYGDRTEQLVVSKLMLNLSKRRPAEFMTSLCVNLRDHVRLRSPHDLRMKAWAALAHGSAALFIDAVDPDGTVDATRYDLVGEVFAGTAQFEPFAGGEPVEDVAVYHSSESRMSFAEDGTPVGAHSISEGRSPHQRALRGACRMLQRAHVPFGVITRRQLGELGRYAVVVLPNVLRMDDDEVEAFRSYVRGGGRLYASGWTSLAHTRGERCVDFMLAGVFGCAFEGEEAGSALFVRPVEPKAADLVAPQQYVSAMPAMEGMAVTGREVRVPRLRTTTGSVVAALTLAYGHPNPGTVFDRNWSSIHSWPPGEDTDRPAIIFNRMDDGLCVFSSFDLEATDAPANERLFVGLVRQLLAERASWGADAHPAVWVSVFDQAERSRMTVSFVNYQADLPPAPVEGIAFTLRAPEGTEFVRVVLAPNEQPLPFVSRGGAMSAELDHLEEFAMVVAYYGSGVREKVASRVRAMRRVPRRVRATVPVGSGARVSSRRS